MQPGQGIVTLGAACSPTSSNKSLVLLAAEAAGDLDEEPAPGWRLVYWQQA